MHDVVRQNTAAQSGRVNTIWTEEGRPIPEQIKIVNKPKPKPAPGAGGLEPGV